LSSIPTLPFFSLLLSFFILSFFAVFMRGKGKLKDLENVLLQMWTRQNQLVNKTKYVYNLIRFQMDQIFNPQFFPWAPRCEVCCYVNYNMRSWLLRFLDLWCSLYPSLPSLSFRWTFAFCYRGGYGSNRSPFKRFLCPVFSLGSLFRLWAHSWPSKTGDIECGKRVRFWLNCFMADSWKRKGFSLCALIYCLQWVLASMGQGNHVILWN